MSVMNNNDQTYHSYLLRIWRSGTRWLAALEDTRTGERRGFESLAAAFAFLDGETRIEVQEQPGGFRSRPSTNSRHE
jgi:hypothetical protein